MYAVKRMALISLLTVTAGCAPNFVIFVFEDSGALGELIEGTGPDGLTNGEPDGGNSGNDAASDRLLLRLTAPDGSTITAGSSLDPLDPYQDWIDVVSVHQGDLIWQGSRATASSFHVVKYVDKCSVKLYDCVLNGTRFPKAELMIRRGGSSSIMTIVLEGAHITSIEFQSHPDDMPTEEFVLTWEKISWTY
jgi:type VI secretion system secreted protein Hcp